MRKNALILPLSVRASYLMAVIGKLAGEPYDLVDQEGAVQIRFTGTQGPLSSLRLNAAPLNEADPLSRVLISFRAADGMRRNWEFFPEMEDEGGKGLFMEDTPLSIAIARRLCQVFGGRLFRESLLPSAPIEVVDPAEASWRSGSGNTSPAQFQEFLAQLPGLTRHELAAAVDISTYPSADADAILALSAPRGRQSHPS